MTACHVNEKEQVMKLRKGGEVGAPVSATSVCIFFSEFPRCFSISSNMPDHIFFVFQLRMVQHASALGICHTSTLEHKHLTQFLVCEFLCQPQACQRGPFMKRTLHMMCICLSVAAVGLVSLAGCEVQNPSHLTQTAAETIQVPSSDLPMPCFSILILFIDPVNRI
jgi:hypothetical protein